jgi:hypothetical protein
MPALPLDEAGKYVAGAYVVFVGLLLIYVAIIAVRLDRMRRDLTELADLADSRSARPAADPVGAESGADQDSRGEAEGKVLLRETSSRQEVS